MKLIKSLALLSILVSITQACVINIYPDTTSGLTGDTVNITLSIKKQHLNCPLPLDSTGIEITGATIIHESEWQQINIVNYQKTMTILLDESELVELTVSRLCNIKLAQTTILIENLDPLLQEKQNTLEKDAPF